MKYIPPPDGDISNPNRSYQNANPSINFRGSIIPAEAVEHVQREVEAVITDAGLTPDSGNLTQLKQAINTKIAGITTTVKTVQYLKTGTVATYNRPANCKRIRVRMVGAGGGGASQSGGTGTSGGDTSFNGIVAKGGGGSVTKGGDGGTGGSGTADLRIKGQDGSCNIKWGGAGGSSPFGGAGNTGAASASTAGAPNSGSGGGGGYTTNVSTDGGGGGGAGEYVEFSISNPSATYTYTIGAGGNGGTAGPSNQPGAAGGSGLIIVEEYY